MNKTLSTYQKANPWNSQLSPVLHTTPPKRKSPSLESPTFRTNPPKFSRSLPRQSLLLTLLSKTHHELVPEQPIFPLRCHWIKQKPRSRHCGLHNNKSVLTTSSTSATSVRFP